MVDYIVYDNNYVFIVIPLFSLVRYKILVLVVYECAINTCQNHKQTAEVLRMKNKIE